MSYKNPAAAVGECRRAGKRGDAVLVCALNKKPAAAGPRWTSEAARLAKKSGGLSGARRRRRRSR